MATIIVEGIPEALIARLRLLADDSGRSLSREVVVQLARSLACSREYRAASSPRPDSLCAAGCHCITRQVAARAVGWGGSAG